MISRSNKNSRLLSPNLQEQFPPISVIDVHRRLFAMMAWVRNGWVGGFLLGAMLNWALFLFSTDSSFPGSHDEKLTYQHDATRSLGDLEEENEEEVCARTDCCILVMMTVLVLS